MGRLKTATSRSRAMQVNHFNPARYSGRLQPRRVDPAGAGPNLDVVGAAADAGLPFVLAHGETAATIMAATCADLTGAPGAVVVTRGPGLASAVNGIAHAALDRLPLVVIADTVPARDRDRISHQRLDQAALGRSVAKAVVTVGG